MFVPKNLERYFSQWDNWREITGEQLDTVAEATGTEVWDVLKYWLAYLDEKGIIAINKEKE